jgi:aspartyl protease family protein
VVSTANGKINAAPATLDRVEAGGITIYDVPALVLPDEVLSTSLLGMSFLSRLKRYEVANERLVLEQ